MSVSDALPPEIKAALRPIVGGGEVQVVGALSDHVLSQMAWPRTNPSVWLHPSTVTHIYEQRSELDGQLVLNNMAETITSPDWFGPDPSDTRRIVLVRKLEPATLSLCIAVKLVRADKSHSGYDEIWVSTGFPVRTSALTGNRWRNKLQPLIVGPDN